MRRAKELNEEISIFEEEIFINLQPPAIHNWIFMGKQGVPPYISD